MVYLPMKKNPGAVREQHESVCCVQRTKRLSCVPCVTGASRFLCPYDSPRRWNVMGVVPARSHSKEHLSGPVRTAGSADESGYLGRSIGAHCTEATIIAILFQLICPEKSGYL